MKQILEKFDIEYRDEDKYNTTCPNCGPERTKSDQKCLQVFNEAEEDLIIWQCNHPDCEWNIRQVHSTKKSKANVKSRKPLHKIWSDKGEWNNGLKELFEDCTKYKYYNKDEQLWFYVLRRGHGKDKDIWPISYMSDGTYTLTRPSAQLMPYRIEKFDPSKPVLIVEGEKAADYAASIAKTYNVLSWCGGSGAIGKTDWDMLDGCEVTFWPDAGDAGEKAAEAFKMLCVPSKLYVIDTSDLDNNIGIDDIDKSELKEYFANKTEVSLDVELPGELDPEKLQELHSVSYEYIKTGFPNVDKHVRLPNSGMVVISGRTNHGKTNIMINMALNLAKQEDLTVLFLSYEFPLAELNIRMVKALDGKKRADTGWEGDMIIDDALKNMSIPAAKEYQELLRSRRLRVADERTSLKQVFATMNRLKALKKKVVVFVDYLQVIPVQDDINKNRYQQLKDMVETIRAVANKNNQLLIGGSQLTAGEKGYQDTVRESKDIEFTSALHLKVWNKAKAAEKKDKTYEDVPGDILLIVEKARQGGNANGRKFGFVSENGCDLKPVSFKPEILE